MPDRRMLRRARLASVALLAAGIATTTFAAGRRSSYNRATVRDRFEEETLHVADQLVRRVQIFEYGLRGMRGVIQAMGEHGTRRSAIRDYSGSREIDREFTGARGFGFIRRVPAEAVAEFVEAARRDDAPDFAIHQIASHDGERDVIQYIEPVARNEPAIGLDIASEPKRHAAAVYAMDTGLTTITAPITLVQASGLTQRSFLILLPIYRPRMPLTSPEDRRAAAYGWSYVPIVSDEVLNDFALGAGNFAIALYDVTTDGHREHFFGSLFDREPEADDLVNRLPRSMFGRRWEIEVWSRPSFLASLNLLSPESVLVVGTLISLLVAALLYAFLISVLRHRQVLSQSRKLHMLVDNSSDAIVLQSVDGRIASWNAAAERIFGYPASDAVGKRLTLFAATDASSITSAMAVLRHSDSSQAFDTVCRRRDGTRFDVSIAASPITDVGDDIAGIALTIRDTSAARAAERDLRELNAALDHQVSERTALHEGARRDLETILDALPSMIGYWDHNLVNRFANRAYCEWYRPTHDQVVGCNLRDMLGGTVYARHRARIDGALAGVTQQFELEADMPNGQGKKHLLVHYLPNHVEGEARGFYALIHDVTELTQSRLKLAAVIRDNEALLSALLRLTLVSVVDCTGRIIEVNEAFCQIAGYTREELLGRDHRMLSSGVHSRELWREMWSTIASGKPWRGEICNRARDGSLYWVDTMIAPFYGDDRQIEKYISIRTDITASKAVANELAQERQRLDNILSATNVGTWEWNLQTGETRINERWAQMIGYRCDELAPVTIQTLLDHAHSDELRASQELLRRHIRGELEHLDCELRMKHRDGHWIWVHVRGRLSTRTAVGKPEWMHGTQQDITTRKEAQRRVADSEAFLMRAEQVAGVGGWELMLESGKITWTNETRRIHEVSTDYVPRLDGALAFYPAEAQRALHAAIDHTLSNGQGWDLELPFITAKGRACWVRTMGEVECVQGKPVRLTGAFQDITPQRNAAEALRQATLAAEAASAAKSAFLANMSHEIRTPLNAVIGLSYLLEQSALSTEQRSFVSKIQVASRSLLGVVNDVLDLSKIEAGEMAIEDAVFDLRELVQELELLMAPQAEAKQLRLRVSMRGDVPAVIRGDATRVRQILTNFLSNALKFTERGFIEVAISCIEQDGGHCTLRYAVRDTGIGIAPEVQSRLFTPFTQADVSTTRRFGGTGLGLSIVRRLAQLCGGATGVESVVGTGSEFWATLVHRIEDAGMLHSTVSAFAVMEVVIAEGDPAQRASLLAMSRALGWRVEAVESGAQLIARLTERVTGGQAPDVVIVDWKLPELGGLQALAALAARFGREQLPAVVVAATHDAATVQRAPGGDFASVVISKPATSSMLFDAVNSSVARRTGRARVPVSPATAPVSLVGIRVLVVDDSDINLEVARRILESAGSIVDVCMNGQQAVEILADRARGFDVVLMDVQMPVMDGNTATSIIRNELRLSLPVVALTAGALIAERQRSFDAGMTDFLSKPLDPQFLLRTVLRHVSRARGVTAPPASATAASTAPRRASVLPSVPVATSVGATPLEAAGWPVIEGIDGAEVSARLDHDVGLFTSMLVFLLRELEEILEQVPLDPHERELAAKLHKLKGSAATLGANALRAAAADAEHAVKHAPPSSDAPAKLRELVDVGAAFAHHARSFVDARAALASELPEPACEPVVLDGAELRAGHTRLLTQQTAKR